MENLILNQNRRYFTLVPSGSTDEDKTLILKEKRMLDTLRRWWYVRSNTRLL